jgi:hypothetical protein
MSRIYIRKRLSYLQIICTSHFVWCFNFILILLIVESDRRDKEKMVGLVVMLLEGDEV